MPLTSFHLNDFRNFNQADLNLSDKCNVFYGKNGSGKTSLLEAIYYLILGRSFRSHLLRRVVRHGASSFSLFGKIKREEGSLTSVGVTRSTESGKKIKIAGKNVLSNLEITRLMPIQLLNHNSFLLLYEGPKVRRQFIDWGLFHVEQSFLDLWRKVERILEQRNTALRKKLHIECIKAWDQELSQLGIQLHNYRRTYIESLLPVTKNILNGLLGDFSINISYAAGWDTNLDLHSALANNLKTDLQFGYTTIGPHRADLRVTIGNVPAKDVLSRGQQKLLLYGLQISQGVLLNNLTNKQCIYLVDDLLAELDTQRCKLLINLLINLQQAQLLITGLTRSDLETVFIDKMASREIKTFHLGNGVVNSVES